MIIYKLKDIPKNIYDVIGGKAEGLRELIRAGLNVPNGFVITDMNREEDFPFAVDYYARSGLKNVAVRSSVVGEATKHFSSAGQYQTVLNVSDKQKLLVAIKKCIKSLKSSTSTTYSELFTGARSGKMAIVIQSMVDAKFSGVCFSKNPVSGKSEIVIEATRGISDSLVLGKIKPRKYRAPYREEEGKIVDIEPVSISEGAKLISNQELSSLCKDVAKAVNHFGHPLNLEWAIDKSGNIHWLQARPITTLDAATLNELDGLRGNEETVFTTASSIELLPEVVTPLTLSTTVGGLDYGLRSMLVRSGVYTRLKHLPPHSCIASFDGHLFLNLSSFYKMITSMSRTCKEDLETSLAGKVLNTPYLTNKRNIFIRMGNAIRFAWFFMSRKRAMKKIDLLNMNLEIIKSDDISQFYKNIDAKIDYLSRAAILHCVTSAHYSVMSSSLHRSVRASYSSGEAESVFSCFLGDIDGMEDRAMNRAIRNLAREILRQYPAAIDFSRDKLLDIIKNDDKKIKESYDNFISRHGHRSVREAELRNSSWRNNEPALMDTLLTLMRSGLEEQPRQASLFEFTKKKFLKTKKIHKKPFVKFILSQTRKGAFSRDYTKTAYIKVIDVFKTAYAKLAGMMVEQGIIKDADQIYYLTHEEIGKLILDGEVGNVKLAVQRRKLAFQQSELRFKEVNIGTPKAVKNEGLQVPEASVLSGVPISKGEVRGFARIVRNSEDLKNLKDSEIMIALNTDINWTQYYPLMRGLITEVGSSLSHGGIIAREYCLPFVANVSEALTLIKTGDYLHLNATKGIVTILKTN